MFTMCDNGIIITNYDKSPCFGVIIFAPYLTFYLSLMCVFSLFLNRPFIFSKILHGINDALRRLRICTHFSVSIFLKNRSVRGSLPTLGVFFIRLSIFFRYSIVILKEKCKLSTIKH